MPPKKLLLKLRAAPAKSKAKALIYSTLLGYSYCGSRTVRRPIETLKKQKQRSRQTVNWFNALLPCWNWNKLAIKLGFILKQIAQTLTSSGTTVGPGTNSPN